MPSPPSRKRRPIVLGLIALTVVSLILLCATLLSGRVTGREFSPTNFTSRSFTFWEIPLIHVQVSPISRSPDSSALANFLLAKNYLQVPPTAPKKWDLIEISRGLTSVTLADAEILTSYLELNSTAKGIVWQQWSADNPRASAVFWPYVHRLAMQDLYLLTPELFAIAEQETDPVKLVANIDAWLRNAYLELAKDLAAADRTDLAIGVIQDALLHYPDDQPARDFLNTLPSDL